MTKTANRSNFLSNYSGKQLNTQKMQQDAKLREAVGEAGGRIDDLTSADLNRDGKIAGTQEMNRLFTELDRYDKNGSSQSFIIERADGSATAPGKALSQLGLLAEKRQRDPSEIQTLTFAEDRAAEPGTKITLAAVGDLLLHGSVQQGAENLVDKSIQDPTERGASGYEKLLEEVKHDLSRADITMANLEVPLAEGLARSRVRDASGRWVSRKAEVAEGDYYDKNAYTSYPQFNAHPSFARAISNLGIDVVTTANNHALDRSSNGIDKTLDALDAEGIAHAGTARYEDGREVMPFDGKYTVVEADGVRLGVLSYTYGTNGITDHENQVSYLKDGTFARDIQRLRERDDVDMVVVAPHWGAEYRNDPSRDQVRMAHDMLEAGADLVIGSHPHVLQPLEKYVTRDGREGLVAYSLGNFLSGQKELPRRSSMILNVEITKPESGDKAFVSSASYLPVHVTRHHSAEAGREIFTPEVIDRAGKYADARDHIADVVGAEGNIQDPDAPPGSHPKGTAVAINTGGSGREDD